MALEVWAKLSSETGCRGYTARPHTGLGALLQRMAYTGWPRVLVFTRDVLTTANRDDVDIRSLPRTRKEAIELLESRHEKGGGYGRRGQGA